jgi:4,5-dihydroxyphthalate decarboxylase
MARGQDIVVEIPPMRYDITWPLLEGRVPLPGVTFTQKPAPVMVYKDEPVLREGSFGLADFNTGYLLPAIEAGWEIIGLPVFSKRKPALQYIFVRNDRGIESPKDLAGKRIATRGYRTALTIFCRGFLEHRYGVDVSTMRWVVNAPEVFPIYKYEDMVELSPTPDKSPVDALMDGDVDAMITDISDVKLFDILEQSPLVRRLFPNYEDEDYRIYQETGIYTPVHMMVMSKQLDRAHPGLAAQLYAAFVQSKEMAYSDILSDLRGFSILYLRERMQEQMERWGDPFKYGITANQSAIDTFHDFNLEQGMIKDPVPPDRVFAASVLDT